MIEIDHEQAERPRQFAAACAKAFELTLEAAHVEKTGFRVSRRLLLQGRYALEPVKEDQRRERKRGPPGIGRDEPRECDAERRERSLCPEGRPGHLWPRAAPGEIPEEGVSGRDDRGVRSDRKEQGQGSGHWREHRGVVCQERGCEGGERNCRRVVRERNDRRSAPRRIDDTSRKADDRSQGG